MPTIYKLDPSLFQPIRRSYLVKGIIGSLIFYVYMLSPSRGATTNGQENILAGLVCGTAISIFILSLFWVIFFGWIKQKEHAWESVEVELNDDYIALRQLNSPEQRVNYNEIKYLQETTEALFVRTAIEQRGLGIRRGLKDYEDFRSKLMALVDLQPLPTREPARVNIRLIVYGAFSLALVVFFELRGVFALVGYLGFMIYIGLFVYSEWKRRFAQPERWNNLVRFTVIILLIVGIPMTLLILLVNWVYYFR